MLTLLTTPDEWAETYGERLFALGCSLSYVLKVKADIRAHTINEGGTWLKPGETKPKGMGMR